MDPAEYKTKIKEVLKTERQFDIGASHYDIEELLPPASKDQIDPSLMRMVGKKKEQFKQQLARQDYYRDKPGDREIELWPIDVSSQPIDEEFYEWRKYRRDMRERTDKQLLAFNRVLTAETNEGFNHGFFYVWPRSRENTVFEAKDPQAAEQRKRLIVRTTYNNVLNDPERLQQLEKERRAYTMDDMVREWSWNQNDSKKAPLK